MIKSLFACLLGFFASILIARATTLGVVPNRQSVLLNQPFRVDVSFNTQGDTPNALQGTIDFPAGQLSVQNILDGGSPVSFWVTPPAETASDTISFAGIMPDGYNGAASSVVSVWFLPIAPGSATISLANVQVFKNDGEASLLSVATSGTTVFISKTAATSTASRQASLITPDPFTPVISRDPDIYNDAYFLAFSTTDEESGIAYYEVLEVPAKSTIGGSAEWQPATSPYLLRDQSLSSDIYVRAVDHDGNFIVVKLVAEHSGASATSSLALWSWRVVGGLIAVIAIVAVLFLWFFRRRRRRQRS